MQILVDIDGVLKGQKEEPIGTGILMVGTLSVYNSLTFMADGTESQIKHWLDNNKVVDYDRIIVITDEQSHDRVGDPRQGAKGYMINVANNENGVGYGRWTHIDGFSENVIRFIYETETKQ